MVDERIDAIEALLPQTQCRDCGYTGCRPYAQAMLNGEVGTNHCAPGGQKTADALAALLSTSSMPIREAYADRAKPIGELAVIDPEHCIGCTLCIKACPVDAIVGAPKQLHGVIAEHCTGCQLCVDPCPVDCIEFIPHPDALPTWRMDSPQASDKADRNQERYQQRLAREALEQQASESKQLQHDIQAAIHRVRAKRHDSKQTK